MIEIHHLYLKILQWGKTQGHVTIYLFPECVGDNFTEMYHMGERWGTREGHATL
jgi:hypothetical protein